MSGREVRKQPCPCSTLSLGLPSLTTMKEKVSKMTWWERTSPKTRKASSGDWESLGTGQMWSLRLFLGASRSTIIRTSTRSLSTRSSKGGSPWSEETSRTLLRSIHDWNFQERTSISSLISSRLSCPPKTSTLIPNLFGSLKWSTRLFIDSTNRSSTSS